MQPHLRQSADYCIAVLGRNPKVIAYKKANDAFFNDPELATLRKHFNDELVSARKKQYDGTLSQEELDRVRTLQAEISTHPLTRQFTKTRAEVLELLSECNNEISGLLGFNYAQVAAPPARCG